ncbi:transcription termination factor-like [Tropilaelaps mercedesae]|uniref:Transcription termination factor-like n=1 Tax=Tropilaelaps mercedesae TaxID=418985 RepID=A0A1V9X339_9ACAR|nr:transcription termination factor-like [Tropilaelaps mercedesae]
MFHNVSKSLYTFTKILPSTPLLTKRLFVMTHNLKASEVSNHKNRTSQEALSDLRNAIRASSSDINIYEGRFKSAPLSEDALLKLISARRAYWVNNDSVNSAADILSMNVEKIAGLVSEHPILMLLQEQHFTQLIATGFKSEDNLMRAGWRNIERNIELVARFNIETHRLRLASWIWESTFFSLATRIDINTCPEVRALLCSHPNTCYERIRKKLEPEAMTERFQLLFNIFQQYLGTTDSYEMLFYLQNCAFLFLMPVKRIQQLFEIMLNAGVHREHIKKDLWVFRHNLQVAEKRINKARAAGLPNIKPWMLRCTEKMFQKHIRLQSDCKAAIAPHVDVMNFLADKLSCSREEVELMKISNPRLVTVRRPKLAQSLEYLLAEGYKSEKIRKFPRVLFFSHKRVRSRMEAFKEATGGLQQPKLQQLIETPKNFERILARLNCNKKNHSDVSGTKYESHCLK